MAKRRRRRKLYDLDIEEVSLVDRPATGYPFIFVKRDGDIDKREIDLTVAFSTKGTPGSTTISVNGKQIQEVKGFDLYYSPIGEDSVGLSCGYTVGAKGESNGGFNATRSYRMTKNTEIDEGKAEKANDGDIGILGEVAPGIGDDVDADLAKALAEQAGIVKLYIDDCPQDLADAVRNILKLATETELVEDIEVEKEGEVAAEAKPKESTEPKPVTSPQANTQPPLNTDELVSRIAESVGNAVKEAVSTALTERAEAEAAAAAEQENKEEELTDEDLAELVGEAVNEALSDDSGS